MLTLNDLGTYWMAQETVPTRRNGVKEDDSVYIISPPFSTAGEAFAFCEKNSGWNEVMRNRQYEIVHRPDFAYELGFSLSHPAKTMLALWVKEAMLTNYPDLCKEAIALWYCKTHGVDNTATKMMCVAVRRGVVKNIEATYRVFDALSAVSPDHTDGMRMAQAVVYAMHDSEADDGGLAATLAQVCYLPEAVEHIKQVQAVFHTLAY